MLSAKPKLLAVAFLATLGAVLFFVSCRTSQPGQSEVSSGKEVRVYQPNRPLFNQKNRLPLFQRFRKRSPRNIQSRNVRKRPVPAMTSRQPVPKPKPPEPKIAKTKKPEPDPVEDLPELAKIKVPDEPKTPDFATDDLDFDSPEIKKMVEIKEPLVEDKPAREIMPANPVQVKNPAPKMIEVARETPIANENQSDIPGPEEIMPPGPINLAGDNLNQIVEAEGKDVMIRGDDGIVVISGGCGKLTLNGEKNQIQCDSVREVEVIGNQNTLVLGALGGGTIKGDNNELSWGTGFEGIAPIVQSTGFDNEMKRLE